MARAIIRYSFDREEWKASRREMRKRLSASDAGVQQRGTASWETSGEPEPSVEQVLDAIRRVLEGITEAGEPDALDHIWIYIDQAASAPESSN